MAMILNSTGTAVGYWLVGDDNGLHIRMSKKPTWVQRFAWKHLFGVQWIDMV